MISFIQGEIQAIKDTYVVVLLNGVGYKIFTNIQKHHFSLNDKVEFYTNLIVRENVLDLYGFSSQDELTYFELLLNVPKVGPKSALQILDKADINLIYSSVLQDDPDQLQKLSGLGKKTAVNIVNYLSGKIDKLPQVDELTVSLNSVQLTQNQIDAIDALITLGYDANEAREYILKQNNTTDTKSLIQAVLKQIPIP